MKNRLCSAILMLCVLAGLSSFALGQQAAAQQSHARVENTFEAVTDAAFNKELETRTSATTHPLLSALGTVSETRGFTALLLVSWNSNVTLPDLTKLNDVLIEVQPLDGSGKALGSPVYGKIKILAPTKRRMQWPLSDPLSQNVKGARIRLLPVGEKVFVTWNTHV